MKKKVLFTLVILTAFSVSAFAETQSGRNQCRGLGDPGVIKFVTPFSSVPTVTCTAAPILGETCTVVHATKDHFEFICTTPTGAHKPGPMTWAASN